jgi:hypothetical protein
MEHDLHIDPASCLRTEAECDDDAPIRTLIEQQPRLRVSACAYKHEPRNQFCCTLLGSDAKLDFFASD